MKQVKRWMSLLCVLILSVGCFACSGDGGGTKNGKNGYTDLALGDIKNVILMIGDGMGQNHVELGRLTNDGKLNMDDLPHTGRIKTGTLVSGEVTDSAAAGTALATGNKTNKRMIGQVKDEDGKLSDVQNIMEYAKSKGKKTGVITSDDLFGATPACFSAHTGDRVNADEIVKGQIASGVNLLMGAGKATYSHSRYDALKQENDIEFITNAVDLEFVQDSERILAAFARVDSEELASNNSVLLQDMTRFALDYLTCDEGFVLMIEGSAIDTYSHTNALLHMLYELYAFDECVGIVNKWAIERGDTVVIVTADHETGGLQLGQDIDISNYINKASYTSFEHTGSDVYYFAGGYSSELLQPLMENTVIFDFMKNLI